MLSELESTVLGVLWLNQPCTAYAVRQVFVRSLSAHWGGSRGAIYPLLERLEAAGLVTAADHRQGRRRSRLYSLTREGSAELKRWLSPPLPDASHLVNYDPLRARVRFLKILPPKKRLDFLSEAEAALTAHLEKARRQCDEDRERGDTFRYLVNRGGLLSMRSQIAWLREVRRTLEQGVRS